MLKFLIALAELFSNFSAKLHDMSENMPEQEINPQDVISIVQEAIDERDLRLPDNSEDEISARDISGIDDYIDERIDSYDFAYKMETSVHDTAIANIILAYAHEQHVDSREIYMPREIHDMKVYLGTRNAKWNEKADNSRKEREKRVIERYERAKADPCRNDDGTLKDVNNIKI